MNENYSDTRLSTDEKDLEHTLSKLSRLETNDLLSWVDNIVPGWKITQTKQYADEYSVLEQNWINLCQKWNTKPKHIIIVKFIPNQHEISTYKIIWGLINYLTRDGNVIRNISELTVCTMCNSAILSKTVVDRINRARDTVKNPPATPVPPKWNSLCKSCQGQA